MRTFTSLMAVSVCLLLAAETCGSKNEVDPEKATESCFSKESLASVAWQKDQLAFFQQPKSGGLAVVVYAYQNEDFLAFENGFDSGPASHIFDCSGVTLGKRGINYNAFYKGNKKRKVLLEGKY